MGLGLSRTSSWLSGFTFGGHPESRYNDHRFNTAALSVPGRPFEHFLLMIEPVFNQKSYRLDLFCATKPTVPLRNLRDPWFSLLIRFQKVQSFSSASRMAPWIDPTIAPQALHLSVTCSPSASGTMEPVHWTLAFEWGTTGKWERSGISALSQKRPDVGPARQLHNFAALFARERQDF
jgi:hypothetical protein